jgi:hypothetical protein
MTAKSGADLEEAPWRLVIALVANGLFIRVLIGWPFFGRDRWPSQWERSRRYLSSETEERGFVAANSGATELEEALWRFAAEVVADGLFIRVLVGLPLLGAPIGVRVC